MVESWVSCNNSPLRGGAPKEGVSFFREEVRSRVRFLGIVRVLV
jgi:hypothetical protein